jgi:isopentenyl-diphosphate delta-isomerase
MQSKGKITKMNDMVVLVDEKDKEIGTLEKIAAHKEGRLHRSFSIFIFDSNGKMLLQKRALNKYHSGGLWSNTCCSHPRPGESLEQAAHRRLKEEMGFDCDLTRIFHFVFKANLDHGFTEHEFDHVFVGKYDGEVKPNPSEVEDFKWIGIESANEDTKRPSESYTVWFKIACNKVLSYYPKMEQSR